MKNLILLLFIISPFLAFAQTQPHYEIVMNVYRKDKSAIDEYAKEFIADNLELFYSKESSSVIGIRKIDIPPSVVQLDTGVIVNAVYAYKGDTLYSKIGFLSKPNRTKIILLDTKNYQEDYYVKLFLKDRIQLIHDRYKSYLRSKNSDHKNW